MMTKYERTRVIAARTLQIAQGATPLVKPKNMDNHEIALKELGDDKIPLVVV
jgi:DNA-directed RNA polymerase subunit K/omega